MLLPQAWTSGVPAVKQDAGATAARLGETLTHTPPARLRPKHDFVAFRKCGPSATSQQARLRPHRVFESKLGEIKASLGMQI